jgi:hypothetical protein
VTRQEAIDWLLAGDPSVVWQAKRDLLDETPADWEPARHLISHEGWGRQFLVAQDPTGTWGGGLYQPKWTSTHYTLLILRRLGLDPDSEAAIAGCRRLLDDADWVDGGVSYWSSRLLAEKCVNGMVLSITSYFDVGDDRADDIAGYLVGGALADGGWNCRDHEGGTTHSSFHTTISVLEGLLEWKRRTGRRDADAAMAAAREFMLEHRMLRSHTTGEVINDGWTEFAFPPRWHYDILRGLEHLRDAGVEPDPRAEEAVGIVEERRRKDGRWPIGPRYSGDIFFRMETGTEGGRWNTLRALRVLRWWES